MWGYFSIWCERALLCIELLKWKKVNRKKEEGNEKQTYETHKMNELQQLLCSDSSLAQDHICIWVWGRIGAAEAVFMLI